MTASKIYWSAQTHLLSYSYHKQGAHGGGGSRECTRYLTGVKHVDFLFRYVNIFPDLDLGMSTKGT